MSDRSFDLVAAQLEGLKAKLLADLNRDLFRSASVTPVAPLTVRERVRITLGRITAYFKTLWRALKGDDPYDVDYDY